jgi:hypothetical protein
MERATRFVLAAAALSGACQATTTSFVRTGSHRPAAPIDHVRVSVLEPEDAEPLGIIQVYRHDAASIEELMPEFVEAAARAGGNYAKIDDLGVRFSETEETSTKSYECGTAELPRTCTETHTETVEVATLQVLGRAFHVRKRP